MKTPTVMQGIMLGAALVALTGCASYPISKDLRKQARPLTLAQVAANPGAYTGTTVIWGGRIINTVNDTNGSALYVLQLPLTHDEWPLRHAVSSGRFIARSPEFLDPQVFKSGRLVTVAGAVAGVEIKPLQGIRYAYPIITSKQLHLWQRTPPYYYYPGYWGWYGPGWNMYWGQPGWGWYGPGWDWDEP
jgi:outer membrane lipoprotein